MSRGRWVLIGLALGCARGDSPRAEPEARLEVSWTGSDTGRLAGAAVAEWCDTLRMLEIRAVRGDSGAAIALFPTDRVRPDSYPVRPPAQADSTRPAAAVALRWFAETAVKGFRSDSGGVVVEPAPGGRLSGRFAATLQSATDGSRLRARGTFHGLRVVPSTHGCVPRPAAQPRDTGVH
jgi:hypothetical protein